MGYTSKAILKDKNGKPIPQEWDGTNFVPKKSELALAQVLTHDNAVTTGDPGDKTHTLPFAAEVTAIEIWHDQPGIAIFTVNGSALPVGPDGWRDRLHADFGTPSVTVIVPDDGDDSPIECIVKRLV